MPHKWVSELSNIGSDIGLSTGRPQSIIWINTGKLTIRNTLLWKWIQVSKALIFENALENVVYEIMPILSVCVCLCVSVCVFGGVGGGGGYCDLTTIKRMWPQFLWGSHLQCLALTASDQRSLTPGQLPFILSTLFVQGPPMRSWLVLCGCSTAHSPP